MDVAPAVAPLAERLCAALLLLFSNESLRRDPRAPPDDASDDVSFFFRLPFVLSASVSSSSSVSVVSSTFSAALALPSFDAVEASFSVSVILFLFEKLN